MSSTITHSGSVERTSYHSDSADIEPHTGVNPLRARSATDSDRVGTLVAIGEAPKKARYKDKRTSRRFVGFVCEFGPEQATVLLQEGTTYQQDLPQFEYSFPSSYLRKYSITLPNQPFEMTEKETEGEVGKTYVFKPLAAAQDFRREKLDIADRIDALIAARKGAKL